MLYGTFKPFRFYCIYYSILWHIVALSACLGGKGCGSPHPFIFPSITSQSPSCNYASIHHNTPDSFLLLDNMTTLILKVIDKMGWQVLLVKSRSLEHSLCGKRALLSLQIDLISDNVHNTE